MSPLYAEALEMRANTPKGKASILWTGNLAATAIDRHEDEAAFIAFLTANNCFTFPRRTDDPQCEEVAHRWLARLKDIPVEESPYCSPDTVFNIEGKKVSTALLYQLYCAQRIETIKPRTVLEIGAGYGGLARVLQMLSPRQYVIVDLVDSLFCSYVYLRANFPRASFYWGGYSVADFSFVPAHLVPEISAFSFDIAINTCSLGEMLPEQRDGYMALVHQTSRHFYSHNRTTRTKGMPDDMALPSIVLDEGWETLFDETNGAGQAEFETPPSRELLLKRAT